MAVKMDDFLLQYFMQLRFNNMPAEVMAQFKDYAKRDDFSGNMKHWKSHLMENGQPKPMPDPTQNGGPYFLEDEEWEKLFREFQNAFRKMDSNRGKFTSSIDFGINNDKFNEFLNEYFGQGRLFDKATASADAETEIANLKQLLESNSNLFSVKLSEWGIISYKDLLEGIKKKKYNTDTEFQDKLKNVARYVSYYANDLGLQFNDDQSAKIIDGFDDPQIDPQKLNNFKLEYDILLRRLASDDKLRAQFPSDKIKSSFDTAKQYVAYDDQNSKDYIPPKREDELTPWQSLKKHAGDTYADVFEKYIKFTGDRLYFSDQAKQIVAGIHKAKIKPTDGIDAVLSKAGDIKKALKYKSPQASEHFDWFAKTMGELKDTMPKAFEGALKNGRQMRVIIEEMIMKAVREGKDKEAKTAMEVLSVIKYGYTTSKIMDALGKEELSIFSDKGLSWNKNEGVQFVTKALDKSIKWAFMGIGYGITIAGNAYKLSGSKFKGNRDRMKGAQQNWANENAQKKQNAQQLTTNLNNQDRQAIQAEQQNRANVNQGQQGANIITDANLQQHKNALTQAQNADTAERTRLDTFAESQQYKDAKTAVDSHAELSHNVQQLNQDIQQINADLTRIRSDLAALQTNTTMSDPEKNARATMLVQQEQQKNADLADKQQALNDANTQLNNIQNNPQWQQQQQIVQTHEQQEQAYTQQAAQTNALDARITQWENATNSIAELNHRIDERNEEMRTWDDNHKDKYMELMAYWDMLESGRDSHTGKMYNWGGRGLSAKKAQQKFNTQKQGYIDNYLNGYSYTA